MKLSYNGVAWKKLSSKTEIDNRWMRVERAAFALPDGKVLEDYWLVEKCEYAIAVGETAEGLVMVREYRPGSKRDSLSFPGGHIGDGESAEEAAAREFREETGWTCGEARYLGRLEPQPGWLKSACHVVHVRALEKVSSRVDAEIDEVLELGWDEARRRVRAGEIDEMHAVAAFYLAGDLLGKL